MRALSQRRVIATLRVSRITLMPVRRWRSKNVSMGNFLRNVCQKLFVMFRLDSPALWQRTDNSIISVPIPNVTENWNLSPFIRLIFLSFAQFAHHLWLECVTGYPAEVIVFFLLHGEWIYLYRVSGTLWCFDLFTVCFCIRWRAVGKLKSCYGVPILSH